MEITPNGPSSSQGHNATAHNSSTSLQETELAISELESALNSATFEEVRQPAFQAVDHDRLADLYYYKYVATGNQSAFNSAKLSSSTARLFGRQAMQNAPPGFSQAAQWCALQGSRLALRHERFGERKYLDEAIDAYEEALKTLPEDSGLRSVVLTNQANCLCTRYEETGLGKDLDDAILKAEEALATAGPNIVTIQNDLSTMYLSKFERDDILEDLDQALQLSRAAVGKTEEDDARFPTRLLPQILSRLAHALYIRYTRAGTSPDVFAALKKGKEALRLADEGDHHEIRGRLSSLVHTCSEEARELDERDEEVQEADLSVEV